MSLVSVRTDVNHSGIVVGHLVTGPDELRVFGEMLSHNFGPAIAEVFYGKDEGQVYIFAEPVDTPAGKVEFRLVCERVSKECFNELLINSKLDPRSFSLSPIDIFVSCEIHTAP